MAAAAGLLDNLDRMTGVRADHAQLLPRTYPEVPGVGARVEPYFIGPAGGRGRADDADRAAVGVDQRRSVATRAEQLTVRVDSQTGWPAVASGHVDAAQEH